MESIYLDHNATTVTRPEVVEAMRQCYAQGYANPASQHHLGQKARKALEDAREAIAELLGANLSKPDADRLILTSGGTEANCMAILGIGHARAGGEPGHVIISALEHPSVIEAAEHLLEQGWRLDTLDVTPEGTVRTEGLSALLTPETSLVSVMLGNHDTGVRQPVKRLATICQEAGVPMHTDAVQVVGKLPIDFRDLGVSSLCLTAHKFGGPLGIGALLVRDNVPIRPLLFGGHQQSGIRPGTESVALTVGMLTALQLWKAEGEAHVQRMTALKERFEQAILQGYPGAVVNGVGAERLPTTSNIGLPGMDGQVLLMALDMSGVACSVGSACSSGSTELSPTLRAMGLPMEIVASSLRFSIGVTTTEAEIDEAVTRILHVTSELGG